MKAIEQYFLVVLFIMLHQERMNKAVLTFDSLGEILKCDLSFAAIYYAVQGGSNF